MNTTTSSHWTYASLIRLLGIWYIPDTMSPLLVVEIALKKWHRPTAALQKLLKMKELNTNVIYASCILWSKLEPEDVLFCTPTLQTLLERLPVQTQAEALSLATNGEDARIVLLLTQFSHPVPQGLTTLVQSLSTRWIETGRCDELALHFYQSLPAYGIPQLEHLWLLTQVYEARHQYVEAEQLLQQLVRVQPSSKVWWHLVFVSHELHHTALVRLERLVQLVDSDRNDTRIGQALEMIGEIIRTLLCEEVAQEMPSACLEMLRALFMLFSTQERSALLTQLARSDTEMMASLLLLLASPTIPGLQAVTQTILAQWEETPRHDTLAMHFYGVLTDYGIAKERVDLLHLRVFIAKGQFEQVEQLFQHMPELQTSPDALWLLVSVQQQLKHSPQALLETLQRFIACTSSDPRIAQAWVMIGDMYSNGLNDGMAAVQAYRRAEVLGVIVPQLLDFRMGNWNTILALRSHPDYAFPVTVAVDIEADPKLGAKPGERVFEVAAVRMKGRTTLHSYQSYIRRPFKPAKLRTNEDIDQAPEPMQVASALQTFIASSLVVGHNLRAFDAKELRGMGVPIAEECIIDTLTFVYCLYPDSSRHNLALLCKTYRIQTNHNEWHTALHDACACGQLLYELGDELVRRGETLLDGVRALTRPGSAFDCAILQPRNLAANAQILWSFDARPSPPHILTTLRNLPASPGMQKAVRERKDVLVELNDAEGAYVAHLPTQQRSVVTVDSYTRIEHMLAALASHNDVYVLPDPQTMLCPQKLRTVIEQETDDEYRVLLFCLYQASHNHDAHTLYPFRFQGEETEILKLRQDLMRSCCTSPTVHHVSCPTKEAHLEAIRDHRLLFAIHEAFVHQEQLIQAHLIIVDNVAELQMHLAEYCAIKVNSELVDALKVTPTEQDALMLLQTQIATCIQAYAPQTNFHERLPLRSLIRFLREPLAGTQSSLLSVLKGAGNITRGLADAIDRLCTEALQEPTFRTSHMNDEIPEETNVSNILHVYWLDVWFSDTNDGRVIERWTINGLHEELAKFFTTHFWQPYQQHILCGTALTADTRSVTFLERVLNIPRGLPILKDTRPTTRVYVPDATMLAYPGLLRRYSWALQVGNLLHALSMQSSERKILLTLNQKVLSTSLANALYQTRSQISRQILSTELNWSLTKIEERLLDPERDVLALVSPRARRTWLNVPVDVEVSGPLQFLDQNDPLIAAQMQLFRQLYPQETPFQSYLLPQALLELKARLSTNAKLHIVLDSRLYTKSYRDEVFAVLGQVAHVEKQVDALVTSEHIREAQKIFLSHLAQQLEQHGYNVHDAISDEELLVALRRFWDTNDFKSFVSEGNTVSQKQVVRGVLEGKDQLLVAATGGGKSLCFQLPALLLAEDTVPKVTVVFSPLVSLMSDQVAALQQKGIFSAIVLNSTLSSIQKQENLKGLARGDYSIVYVAPEQIRSSAFRRALEQREIGFIAVDEAHCLSQWGHDFRTDYFAVKDWTEQFTPAGTERSFPILALTATARKGYTSSSQKEDSDQTSTIEDIIKQLNLRIKEEQAIITSPERSELDFRVEQFTTPPCSCSGVITFKNGKGVCQKCQKKYHDEKEQVEQLKLARLAYLLNDNGASGLRQRWNPPSGVQQRGLIYCAYSITIPVVAAYLKKHVPDLRVGMYYGSLDAEEKDRVLQAFKSDGSDRLDVVIATNAFGMGVDVRRLGFVIHFDVPGTPEAYYQEAGRAGRDKMFRDGTEKAVCILLYHPTDLEKPRYLSRKNTIAANQVKDVYDVLCQLRSDIGKNVAENKEDVEGTSREIITTEQDLAIRAGVSEDQIGMILYYLENHATLCSENVLKRGETVSNILKVKFENGYQQRIEALPQNSPSRPLLIYFQQDSKFGLQEETSTDIPMKELAQTLKRPFFKMEQELLNLVRRNIVSYVCQGRIKWTESTRDAACAREKLLSVRNQIWEMLGNMHIKHPKGFVQGEQVFEELTPIYLELQLQGVSQQQLFHFLSALSHSSAGTLRLFDRFTRVIRGKKPGSYMVRLLTNDRDTLKEKIKYIFRELDDVIVTLEQQRVTDVWQAFDLLQFELDYQQRKVFHKKLLLLDILGLLKYSSDPYTGIGMRIVFQQPFVPGEEPVIDLSSLRLKELYETRKLKLMENYATKMSNDERAKAFKEYFYGEQPLLAASSHYARTDLTEQQQELLKRDSGIHLIEGPAGSGKTTVLLEYIKHLVHYKHVPMERILIMTHFRSAINRIADVAGIFQEEYGDLQIRTLNSFGEMIFRKHRTLLVRGDGKPYYKENPEILSHEKEREEQQKVNEALRNISSPNWQHALWPKELKLPERGEPYQSNDNVEKQCLESIRRLREYGLFPSKTTTKEQIMDALGKLKNKPVQLLFHYAVYLEFLQLMGEAEHYTFDDQVLFALAILRNRPELAKEYQNFYEYVIVDELQDFTRAQAELLLLLSEKQQNLVAFGDRDQEIRVKESREVVAPSIFNMLDEKESCGTNQAHQLVTNFRSTQRILDLVSNVRNYQEPEKRPSLTSAHSGYGEYPILLRVSKASSQSGQPSMVVETQLVQMMTQAALEQIQKIPESERGSVALIAARANWSLPIEHYLREQCQDFRVMNNNHLYQSRHVDRILVYLRLIVDKTKDDDVAFWLRSSIVPYFNEQQVKMLQELSLQSGHRLFEVLKDRNILTKIQATPEQSQALEKHLSILALFNQNSRVSQVIDTIRAVENGPIAVLNDDEQKKEDVEQVLAHFSSYIVMKAVEEIQQHISYLKESQKHTGLTLVTIDNAKSEEFDTVFLLGAHLLKYPDNAQVSPSDKRRMYVSLSRARQRLFLVVHEGIQGNELLASIPKHLYEERVWSPSKLLQV